MVFSSPWFLVFLLATLGLLSLPFSNGTKKRLLSVASCFFYAAWDYRYLGLLLAISAIDYFCAAKIFADRKRGRPWLLASMITNLGLLGYFKYCNFFLDNLNGVLATAGVHLPAQSILLPAGISFYTFKTMSYVIDVYRGEIEPVESLLDYVMFVTFFPELIAGPIVRASVFLPQMTRPIGPTTERMAEGWSLFLLGLTKKTIADRLGVMVTPVFGAPSHFDTPTLWAATLGYTIQIYCDFSGYSDMAVGTARMIGYDLPENFAMPYLSRDLSEFWRRWHITLSSWLRDYLYISLGGNRRGPGRTYLNLALTMLLGGLWHGASWNFVLWGALHGAALALHRLYTQHRPRGFALPSWLAVPITFLFVSICWIPFRCVGFGATSAMLRGMVGLGAGTVPWVMPDLWVLVGLLVIGHVLGVLIARRDGGLLRVLAWFGARVRENVISGPMVRLAFFPLAGACLTLTWAVLVFLFDASANTPFIYFQF